MGHLTHYHLLSRVDEALLRWRCSSGYPCIIPPYVLDEIALQGEDAAREAVLRTRRVDDSVRMARALTSLAPGFVGARAPTRGGRRQRRFQAAIEAQVQRAIYTAQNRDRLPGEV